MPDYDNYEDGTGGGGGANSGRSRPTLSSATLKQKATQPAGSSGGYGSQRATSPYDWKWLAAAQAGATTTLTIAGGMRAASRPEAASRINPGALLAICLANVAGAGAQGPREQSHRIGRYVTHNGATTWLAAEYDGNNLYGTQHLSELSYRGVSDAKKR